MPQFTLTPSDSVRRSGGVRELISTTLATTVLLLSRNGNSEQTEQICTRTCTHDGIRNAHHRRPQARRGKALQGHGEALQRHGQVPHLTPHSAPMAPHLR